MAEDINEHFSVRNPRRVPGVARRQQIVDLPSGPPTPSTSNASSSGWRRESSETVERLSANELVRLDNPRPDILRTKNEYISVPACADSEFSEGVKTCPTALSRKTPHRTLARTQRSSRFSSPSNFDRPKIHGGEQKRLGEIRPLVRPIPASVPVKQRITKGPPPVGTPLDVRLIRSADKKAVITSQPLAKATDSLDSPRLPLNPASLGANAATGQSIITCRRCGKCRCSACSTPRPLPSLLLCQNGCLLSPESVVDAVSCMCCVRGCLYHFGGAGNSEEESGPPRISDSDLCSCESPGRCIRWSCLAGALVCIPCVWCYLPLKGCTELCGLVYSGMRNRGCQCSAGNLASSPPHPVIKQPERIFSSSSGNNYGYPQGRKDFDVH